jgi:hypothetical protein
VVIWYIFPVLVFFIKKNLATLVTLTAVSAFLAAACQFDRTD